MRRAARSLRRAFSDGHDADAREDMAVASLFGGLALANAGLGAVHGFAGPIGGMFPAPHGAVCAALLPHVMAANLRALRQRQPDGPALARYRSIAAICHRPPDCDSGRRRRLGPRSSAATTDHPAPADLRRDASRHPRLVAKAQAASSMKANPIALTTEDCLGS